MLYGEKGFKVLQESTVAVIGIGGVGSFAAEAIVRAGIGKIIIIDCDVIKPSDVNRQLIALSGNAGVSKVEAAKERLRAINPYCTVTAKNTFFHSDTADSLVTSDVDWVIDAIDSVNPKTELISYCLKGKIRIISVMGAAGRTDPTQVRLATLEETHKCPLARIIRNGLRKRGMSLAFPVVYSTERPLKAEGLTDENAGDTEGAYTRGRPRSALPSISTIPPIFGLLAAHHVLISLIEDQKEEKQE